ncbi:MAG TPA: hypothetical protein HPP90_06085 [Deltaproteobacteria bacterium]|nr:hypothetical protein [Deltaproteobacteria bacterium]
MHADKAIEHKEIMELSHEPVPPYRSIFYVAITVASLYLGVILLKTMT